MAKSGLRAETTPGTIHPITTSRPNFIKRHCHAVFVTKLILGALGCYITLQSALLWLGNHNSVLYHFSATPGIKIARAANWKSCGEGLGDEFQCANIAVPLDYRNTSDARTITIAVVRLLASDKEHRKGAVFVNPGGPGGSGTEAVKDGKSLARILKGQYDLIGFDPRGVKSSQPYVSCFDSAIQAEAFAISVNNFGLNLPANFSAFSPSLQEDFARQMDLITASMTSLARHCVARSGGILPYLGTEFVVRDIDFLARIIEGKNARINYWGFSYGTVIGQYMVNILPPERLGRIVLDGVVDASTWNLHADHFFDLVALEDVGNLLSSFASSCLAAGSNCALNSGSKFASASALLARIDEALDALYDKPAAVYGLDTPAIATAADLRTLLYHSMYHIKTWGDLAQRLSEAFDVDFTRIVNTTRPKIHPESVSDPEISTFATHAIACADADIYSDAHPPPKNTEVSARILAGFDKYSRRFGDGHWSISLCHLWAEAGAAPTRSRYGGTVELADDTLDTPILVLSNTYDPITPLRSAIMATERLSNNARLIQQTDGWGHCAVSHVSYCTALATQAYMLDGKISEQKHTLCKVDQVPFEPFNETAGLSISRDEADLRAAWREFSEERN